MLHEILTGGHRLVLSNEMIAEATRVLRYPHFRNPISSNADIVILDSQYRAPFLRDPNDTDVLQTAERGEADILCTHDGDFFDEAVLSFCTARGIAVCNERTLFDKIRTQ